MNARTHVLGGLVAAGVALSLGAGHPLTLVLASGFGGLVPDWDHPHSTFGRWVPWPAIRHSRGPSVPPEVGRAGWPHPIWHRHQAHSVIGVAMASAILTILGLVGWHGLHAITHGAGFGSATYPALWVGLGLGLGGLSHLFLDGFNQTRQWWAWPVSRRGFRWPLHAPVKRTDALASLLLTLVGVGLAWHLGHTVGGFDWSHLASRGKSG